MREFVREFVLALKKRGGETEEEEEGRQGRAAAQDPLRKGRREGEKAEGRGAAEERRYDGSG